MLLRVTAFNKRGPLRTVVEAENAPKCERAAVYSKRPLVALTAPLAAFVGSPEVLSVSTPVVWTPTA